MREQKEIQVVAMMIRRYCKGKHKTKKGLCAACNELLEYAFLKRSKCPFQANKPFCSNCKIHCYKPEMRQKIRAVMRYSGPRIVFAHPIVAMRHVLESKRQKKELDKEAGKDVR